jgi:hypothetical protein
MFISNVLRGTRFVGPDRQKKVRDAIESLAVTLDQPVSSTKKRALADRAEPLGYAFRDFVDMRILAHTQKQSEHFEKNMREALGQE